MSLLLFHVFAQVVIQVLLCRWTPLAFTFTVSFLTDLFPFFPFLIFSLSLFLSLFPLLLLFLFPLFSPLFDKFLVEGVSWSLIM